VPPGFFDDGEDKVAINIIPDCLDYGVVLYCHGCANGIVLELSREEIEEFEP
jgi:hypothetical protein